MAVYAIAVCIIQKDIPLCWETGFVGNLQWFPIWRSHVQKMDFKA